MPLQKFKDPKTPTVFALDPEKGQATAFSSIPEFQKVFPGEFPAPDLPAPVFDTAQLLANPNKFLPVSLRTDTPQETDGLDQPDISVPDFIVPPPKTFDSKTLIEALSKETPGVADIRKFLGKLETQTTEASAIRKRLRDLEATALLEQSNIEGRPGVPEFIIGRKVEDLQRRVALEQLPLTRELEATTEGIKAIEGGISRAIQLADLESKSRKELIDNVLDIERLQLDKEKAYQAQIDKMTDNARLALNTIITNFGGLAFEDLSPESQKQLRETAKLAGMPEGLLRAGLQTVKDRQILNQKLQLEATIQQREIQNEFAQQRIAIAQQNANINALLAGLISGQEGQEGGLPAFIQNATGAIKNFEYIDMSKLTPKQLPIAQQYAVELGIPLLPKEDVNKLQEAQANYGSARALLDQITEQITPLINATTPKDALIQAGKLQAESLVPSKARTYKKTIEAFSALLTRAAGEKGTLATMDVARIINALPGFYETTGSLTDKISNLNAVFEGQVDGAIRSYLGTKSKVAPQGSIGVPTPDGKTYYFPTQEKADEFKRKAGISFNTVGKTLASIKLGSPLARANNNPGNLRFVGQAGATQGKGGFARFATPEAGVKALENQIALDASRGHSLTSFISKYAPPSENDTRLYIQQAIKALGVAPNTPIAKIDRTKLTQFIAKKESSSIIG